MTRILSDFLGAWSISRRIVLADMPDAQFDGSGIWTADTNGALYHEMGKLMIVGQPAMQSERKYRWTQDMSVYFDDGRFFHQVPSEGGETEHWCDPDRYMVTYDFDEWPTWQVRWRVLGPKKDYIMTSDYKRP
jgi:hypothetical protein